MWCCSTVTWTAVVFLRSYYRKFCVVAFWQNIEVCSVLALGNYLSKSSSFLNEIMFCDSGRNSSWILFGCQLGEANPTLTIQYDIHVIRKGESEFCFLELGLTKYLYWVQYMYTVRVKRERWKVDYDDVEWMQFILIILYAILVEWWHSISSVIEQNNNYCTLANALGLDHIIIIVCIVFPLPLFVVVIITLF